MVAPTVTTSEASPLGGGSGVDEEKDSNSDGPFEGYQHCSTVPGLALMLAPDRLPL